jgi:hypothetical protein
MQIDRDSARREADAAHGYNREILRMACQAAGAVFREVRIPPSLMASPDAAMSRYWPVESYAGERYQLRVNE